MSNYMSAIANAFNEAKAWKYATLALSVVCSIQSIGLIYQSVRAPTYLIPHQIASAKGPMKVQPGADINVDYLQYIAMADLELVLTWQPRSVEDQFARFLNRLTPSLYASQHQKLVDDSKKFRNEDTTQAFYRNGNIQISQNNKVRIPGILVRWNGDKMLFREDFNYILTYQETGGMLYLDNLVIEKTSITAEQNK